MPLFNKNKFVCTVSGPSDTLTASPNRQAILARQDEDVTAKVYTCLVDTQLKAGRLHSHDVMPSIEGVSASFR
jgi:hypothetical protein